MKPYYDDGRDITIYHGDALEVLPTFAVDSVDSVVTDPPYGLSFMGKDWDHGVPGVPFWREALRVAKPGAHLLAFGGTRTFHRLAVAIEDAGWDIRDTVMWVYGSGFPKSLDVGKAIDKAAGAEREIVGYQRRGNAINTDFMNGWGTALKPSYESVCVARKPLEGTVAANVLKYGTGALNIDGCRVGFASDSDKSSMANARWTVRTGVTDDFKGTGGMMASNKDGDVLHGADHLNNKGRWPANLIHDGSDEVLDLFPETKSGKMMPTHTVAGVEGRSVYGADARGGFTTMETYGDSGSAARFFYCPKASKRDRDEGCEGLELRRGGAEYRPNDDGAAGLQSRLHGATNKGRNYHPTVKPTALMRYLCRLVTPPGGLVLDPFMGSGSTGKAAIREGFRFVGVDLNGEYCEIAAKRLSQEVLAL